MGVNGNLAMPAVDMKLASIQDKRNRGSATDK